MKISKQARRDAKQLVRSSFVNGMMDEGRVRQAIHALLTQKPRGYVAILAHMQRLVRLEVERRTARIESATALSPQDQSGIQTNLAKRYGQGLSISFVHSPALIGGMRIKVGSDVYDGSVQGRLNALKESF
jgi:F-type H+-transporting ATPase subunit delta